MRTMTASEFRSKWLEVFQEISASGTPGTITRRGRPYLRLEVDPGMPTTPGDIPQIAVRAIGRSKATLPDQI
jgi:hypothetical protein